VLTQTADLLRYHWCVRHDVAVQRDFALWPSRYEPDLTSRRLGWLQRRVLGLLDLRPDDVLCDVGCGSGAGIRAAAAAGVTGIGIDLSPRMLARARRLASALPSTFFAQAGAHQLPLATESCTAVLCTTSLHHHADPAASVRDMARVLAPGGRLAVADFCTDAWQIRIGARMTKRGESNRGGFPSSAALRLLARDAGLTRIRLTPLLPFGTYVAVTAYKAGASSKAGENVDARQRLGQSSA
jgi:ubiquinone/menaquinone biosynthesis C-methylase UbiE